MRRDQAGAHRRARVRSRALIQAGLRRSRRTGGGKHAPVSPVDDAATRVTGRRVIQYIIDYVLAGIIPGLAYWLLDRGSGFLHGLGWLLATVIALGVYYWYWVERPRSHGGQT